MGMVSTRMQENNRINTIEMTRFGFNFWCNDNEG